MGRRKPGAIIGISGPAEVAGMKITGAKSKGFSQLLNNEGTIKNSEIDIEADGRADGRENFFSAESVSFDYIGPKRKIVGENEQIKILQTGIVEGAEGTYIASQILWLNDSCTPKQLIITLNGSGLISAWVSRNGVIVAVGDNIGEGIELVIPDPQGKYKLESRIRDKNDKIDASYGWAG